MNLGFSESSWAYDKRLELPKVADSSMAWLRRQPMVYKVAWPEGELSAQLLEMDTEDKFANALNFAKDLDIVSIRGTLYSLTGIALKNRETVENSRHLISSGCKRIATALGRPPGKTLRHSGGRENGSCSTRLKTRPPAFLLESSTRAMSKDSLFCHPSRQGPGAQVRQADPRRVAPAPARSHSRLPVRPHF